MEILKGFVRLLLDLRIKSMFQNFKPKENPKKKFQLSHEQGAGFTIIELLVVVAIIAVLTAIVLVNVTQYISRGRDAAAQGNLATMLTNSAVFYDTVGNSSYTGFNSAALTTGTIAAGTACAGNATFTAPCNAITGTAANGYNFTYACSDSTGTAVNCNIGPVQNWAGMVTLKANPLGATATFCVDSKGNKVLKLAGSVTAVPPNYGKCS
jgi:prepilin-type N-terminal cleavage/methylation domain-containing protein